MKKLIEQRTHKIMILAFLLLGMITCIMALTNPEATAATVGIAAITVGGITLEGKEEALYTALQESITKTMEKYDKGYITESKMTEAIAKAIADSKINLADDPEFKRLNEILTKQGLELVAMKEGNGGPERLKSLEEQIKEQLGEHKSVYEAMEANKGKLTLTVKLPINPMATGTIVSPASAYIPQPTIEPGYDRKPLTARFIRMFANVASIATPLAVWAERFNEDGDAGWTAEGYTKPLISFQIRTKDAKAKKVTARAKFTTETLQDIPGFMAELRGDLLDEIEIREEDGILNGVDGGNDPNGVIPQASAYTLVGVFTENANNFDAVKACITQLKTLNFIPNILFTNPVDKANMELSKGTDGHYLLPPFSTADGTVISGVKVVESNTITAGNFLLGDFSKLNIRDYVELTITLGWENDDFSKNLISVVAEKRIIVYIKTHQLPAFIYESFDTVKAAIEIPAQPA